MKISINLALSSASSDIPLFMSNSEDQYTPVDDNEQEGDGSEETSPRKRNESSSQGVDGPNSKRFRIITEEEEYKWSLPQGMASYANDNSEKYISEKYVKDAILIKTPKPENLVLVKKMDDYLTSKGLPHHKLLKCSSQVASSGIPTKARSTVLWKRFQRRPNRKSESKKAIYRSNCRC